MKKITIFIVSSLLLFSTQMNAQKSKQRKTSLDTVEAFDAYVQKAIKDWEIPGLAIVVVKIIELY